MKRQDFILLGIFSLFALLAIGIFGFFAFEQRAKVKWLSNLALSNILIEADDLPQGYSSGSIEKIEPDEYYKFIQAKRQIILGPDGNQAGEVRVYLFSIKREQQKLYDLLSLMETQEGMIPYDVSGIGEMKLAATDPIHFIIFTRCTAIGYITVDSSYFQEGYDLNSLIAHARNLDERLKSIACK